MGAHNDLRCSGQLTIRDEALICATSSLLAHVAVEGEVTVNREPFESSGCE